MDLLSQPSLQVQDRHERAFKVYVKGASRGLFRCVEGYSGARLTCYVLFVPYITLVLNRMTPIVNPIVNPLTSPPSPQ